MLTGKQLRAARALLDWGVETLASESGVNRDTIFHFERGIRHPRDETVRTLVETFAQHDVEFLPDEGVRMRRGDILRLEGIEGFKKYLDDVYEVAKKSTPEEQEAYPIYCSNVDDKIYMQLLGDWFTEHIRRMTALKLKLRVHIIIKDKPYSYRPEELDHGYRQYRRYPHKMIGDTVFYAYGRKLAILKLTTEDEPVIVIIDDPLVAKAYREQFEIMWQSAIPLEKSELSALAEKNKEIPSRTARKKGNKK